MENDNKVLYLGHYGGDETIALSAWTSTSRDLDDKKRARIPALIAQLWSAEPVPHKSPFEKGIVHFLVDTDIATHIHLLKHRIASINGECLEGNTLISFEDIKGKVSRKIKIKNLFEKFNNGRYHQNTEKDKEYSRNRIKKMRIRVLNEDTGVFEYSHIKDIWKTDIKKIYSIKLRNGKELLCSDNHPIYTKNGYKSINQGLIVGELIGCNGVSFAEKHKVSTEIFSYDKRLNRKVNNLKQIHFSDIISIDYIKDEECYDIEIEGIYKNFVANGIVTHNSARYKELVEDKYYIPQDWLLAQDNEKSQELLDRWVSLLERQTITTNDLYHQCLEELTPILGRKRAKESARYFKMYNSQIQADVMFNMSSFHNFLTQRRDSHAQQEIYSIADRMLEIIKNIEGNPFEHTLKAWNL